MNSFQNDLKNFLTENPYKEAEIDGTVCRYILAGKENAEIMALLHGGGICYRAAIPTAEVLAKKYHVVLVAYDGFNPSEPETEFKSVADEARRL